MDSETSVPSFEKHKVFLYKEDFAHFTEGLEDVINYVKSQVGEIAVREEWTPRAEGESEPESAVEEEKPRRGLFSKLRK